jgi:O-antigen/teichoic acid export membrane protein
VLLGVGYAGWGDGRGYVLGFTALLGAAAVNSNWFLQATKNFAGGVGCALAGVVLSVLLVWALMGQGPLQSTWLTGLTGVLVVCVLIAPQVLLGVGSWWLARRACQRIAESPDALDAQGLLCLLRKDVPLVASQLLLLASTTLGTVVVGQLADAPTTAAYAATEKLFNLGATVLVGLYMALHPRFAVWFYSDRATYWKHTLHFLGACIAGGVCLALLLNWMGDVLLSVYLPSHLAMRVLPALVPFALWLGLCIGQHVLTGYLVFSERNGLVLWVNAGVLLVTIVVGYSFARVSPVAWVFGMLIGQVLAMLYLLQLRQQDKVVGI